MLLSLAAALFAAAFFLLLRLSLILYYDVASHWTLVTSSAVQYGTFEVQLYLVHQRRIIVLY